MDTALVVITLLSLGLTAALLVYALRLQREQREREEARVQVLAAEIRTGSGDGPRPAPGDAAFGAPILLDGGVRVASPMDGMKGPGPALVPVATDSSEGVDLSVPAFGAVFGDSQSRERPRLLIPLVGAAVLGVVLATVYLVNVRPARKAATIAAPAAATSLELLSLQQSRTGTTLTVSGVVRNPGGSKAQSGVAAVVFVFDKAGAFVASGRAPIDYQVLAPGDESPFTVTIPNAGAVARYRVSFRTDHAVLPHVDKRTGLQGSRARGPEGSRSIGDTPG